MKGTPTVKHIPTLLCILPLLAPLGRLRAAESDTLDLDKRTSQGIPFRHNKPSLLPLQHLYLTFSSLPASVGVRIRCGWTVWRYLVNYG